MPANAGAGMAPDMSSWAGRGWQPERTYCTPRCGTDRSHYTGTAPPATVHQRRTADPGPDTLSGERAPRQAGPGGSRWDWRGPAPAWGHSGQGIHEGFTPRSRSTPPARAVAPHRRPAKEVTGKVTGEPSLADNHRPLDTDRTVAPYRRDPTVAIKVSESGHPAHRPGMRSALYGRQAGVSSKQLAEHEVQSQYMANSLDVAHAVSKSVQKAQHARSINNNGLKPMSDTDADGWGAAVRENRAFDGAFGASTAGFNYNQGKHELNQQIRVKGREAHEPSVGEVVFSESARDRNRRVRAAEAVGGGGGGAYVREQVYEGAAGLTTHDHTAVRNRERWAKAAPRGSKGVGMQPDTVFERNDGGTVYGGKSADRDPASLSRSTAREAMRRAEYYRNNEYRGAAGVRTAQQTDNQSASEAAAAAARIGAGDCDVGSGLGHSIKPVARDAYVHAHGCTTRQINSSMPELKASLLAEGAIVNSAESELATNAGGTKSVQGLEATRSKFSDDVPSVVFNEKPPEIYKVQEVEGIDALAGCDTHLINRRNLNVRYHDSGRYGRMGRGKPPTTDATNATVGQALFSAPKPKDFAAGMRLEGGAANHRLEGAAGASSTAVAEEEPLMRYRAPPDQTERQRAVADANAASHANLNFAPEVEDHVFGGTNTSRLDRQGAQPGRRSPGAAGAARAQSPRPQSPRGGGGGGARPSSPRGNARSGGAPTRSKSASRLHMSGAERFAGGQGSDVAAGTSTMELNQKEPLLGGPGGPDHVTRDVRVAGEVRHAAHETSELLASAELSGKPSDPTGRMRAQKAYSEAAGASTHQIEQQFSSLPVDRTKDARGSSPPAVRRELGSRGHPSKADAAQGQKPLLRKANPNPLSQANLFEKECTPRPESPRSLHERQNPKAAQRKPAGLKTATIARNEPYFLTDLDAGVKLGATHPSRFGDVVFGKSSLPANAKYGNIELSDAPEYRGRLGIPSHKYGARDPLVVGDCPPGNESASATTWKSQVDEVLYGVDLDGSGDYSKMAKAIDNAPQYRGAAGVSSLASAYDAPEVRVDVNTRIETTYAQPEKGERPIAEPIKQKRAQNGYQPPELFSKAGLRGWLNQEKWKGAAPGRDELWRPHHYQGKWFYSG